MLLIDKLKNQDRFTDAERVLANYILNNLSQISHMTIYELSDNSFCSVATISRFCKKLKLKNFNQLKITLVQECSNSINNEVIERNHPFDVNDSEVSIAQKIHSLSVQTLNENFTSLDFERIHEAAVLLDQAEIIDIYANWNSYVSALNLHSKLIWMGKTSCLEGYRGFQQAKSFISNPKHVAVLIAYYGTSDKNNDIVKGLKSSNTPYILLTGPKLNPLCMNAKIVIHVPSEEEYSDKIAAFSSDIAMDYTINVLYSFLFALNYEKNIQARYNVKLHKDDPK